jgi:hypothetical protein
MTVVTFNVNPEQSKTADISIRHKKADNFQKGIRYLAYPPSRVQTNTATVHIAALIGVLGPN